MSVLHPQNCDGGYFGPIQTAVGVRRDRIVRGNEQETVWMIQIHGEMEFALPISLRQFVAAGRSALRGPEIAEGDRRSKRRHPSAYFFGSFRSVRLDEPRPFVELLFKLLADKGYLQNRPPSISINPQG